MSHRIPLGLHIAQQYERNQPGKENAMEFGVILVATNTVMAAFIYFVVRLIWQE